MGSGDAGADPLEQLIRRFGHSGAITIIKRDWSKLTSFFLKLGYSNTCVILDSVQDIEKSLYEYDGDTVESGADSYRIFESSIRYAASLLTASAIVMTMDTDKTRNQAKDMVYFPESGKGGRRNNIKPMMLSDGQMMITDTSIPTGDMWKSMKMGEFSSRQINHYYPNKLMKMGQVGNPTRWNSRMLLKDSLRSRGIDVGREDGSLGLIIDNHILRDHLFNGSYDDIPHHLITANLNKYGSIVNLKVEKKASCISEGELSMSYWVGKLKNEYDSFAPITTDQDIIPIMVLKDEEEIQNVIGVIPKKHKNEAKTGWIYEYLVVDFAKLRRNIIDAYRGTDVKYPVVAEMFLFCLGGCDFFKKPMYRVGYKSCILAEYEIRKKTYAKMVSLVTTPTKIAGFPVKLVLVDNTAYRRYVRNVYLRKSSKTGLKNFKKKDTNELLVMPRQFSFYMMYIMNTPTIRLKTGMVPVFDPVQKTGNGISFWGYKMANVKGCEVNPVCTGAKEVCKEICLKQEL